MPVSQAFILCPHAIFLPPDFDHYSQVSREIMDLLRSFGFRFLQVSIDEAFLDISSCGSFDAAAAFGRQIQEMIHATFRPDLFGWDCSGKDRCQDCVRLQKTRGTDGGGAPGSPGIPCTASGEEDPRDREEIGSLNFSSWASGRLATLLQRISRYCSAGSGAGQSTSMNLLRESILVNWKSMTGSNRYPGKQPSMQIPMISVLLLTSLEGLAASVHQNLAEEHLRCRTITIKLRYQGFETRTKSRTISHLHGRSGSDPDLLSCTPAGDV